VLSISHGGFVFGILLGIAFCDIFTKCV